MVTKGELGSGTQRDRPVTLRQAPGVAGGAEGLRAALGAASRAAWAPIISRVAAGALALVGLAAIGVAARQSPELTGLVPQRTSVGTAQLSGPLTAEPPAVHDSSPAPELTERPCVPAAAVAEPKARDLHLDPIVPRPAPARDSAAPLGQPRADSAASTHEPRSAAPAAAPAGLIALNTADAKELQRLPGVGAKRAQAIVELRERLGGFRRASDLLRIRGIGRRLLERMSPHFVLGTTQPVAARPRLETAKRFELAEGRSGSTRPPSADH